MPRQYTAHKIKVSAVCPVDPTVTDRYDVTVEPPEGVLVYAEAIVAACELFTREPVTQERLTEMLATALRSRVRTEGTHAGGRVTTVCDYEPLTHTVVTTGTIV